MKKKSFLLILGLIAAAALFAGGNKQTQPAGASAQTTAPAQNETIVIGGWPAGDTAFNAIIPMFNEQNPNIEVKIGNFMPSADYHNELQASIAAGTGAPDVAMLEQVYVGMYKDASGFENLLNAPYNAGSMKKDFADYKWDLATSVDGKNLVGLVWDIGPASLFYNSEVFAQVGLPTDPDAVYKYLSTWDGFLDAAKKVYIKDKRWLVCSAADLYGWNFMNRDFYDQNLNLMLDKAGAVDALNAAITMRKNGWDAQVGLWDNEAYAGIGNGSIVTVVAGC